MNLDDLELELRRLPGIRWAAFSDLGDRLLVQLHAMEGCRGDIALEASRIAARHCEVPIAVDLVRWLPPPASAEHQMVRPNGSSSSAASVTPPAPATPASLTTAAPPPPPAPPAPQSFPSMPPSPSSAPSAWTAPFTAPVAAAAPAPAAPPPHIWHEPRLAILGVLTLADTDEIEVHLTEGAARTIGRAARRHGLLGAVEATLEAVRGFPITIELPVAAEWARPIQSTADGRSVVAVALARLGREECYGLASGGNETEAAAGATLDALHRNLRPTRRDGSA